MMGEWQGQKVVIVGAARQGLALARFLALRGARVILNDRRSLEALEEARQTLADLDTSYPVEWVCGGHPETLLDGADWICPSGGVPLELPLLQEARRRGIGFTNDSQVFLEIVPCPVIGITGSAGKTTTTTLVGRMAEAAAAEGSLHRAWIGGNIGRPLVLDVDEMQPEDLAVMELSSFQLEIMTRSPQVAAVLNITPNHLDRHGTMQAYTEAKAHILSHQGPKDIAVLGRDDRGAWSLQDQTLGRVLSFGFSPLPADQAGGTRVGDALIVRRTCDESPVTVMERNQIALRGEHNVMNVLAACTIAAAAGLSFQAMRRGVEGFTGVEHRLEWVRRWGGADWYNNTIATAPERTLAAIHSFDEPLVLLVGGRDKKLPWDELVETILRRVKHLVTFGEAAEIVRAALEHAGYRPGAAAETQALRSVTRCTGLNEAVQAAARLVEPGDVVLLSPGGTSFDEFIDFEERGRCFAQWVRDLP